jgi:hypothetical protein
MMHGYFVSAIAFVLLSGCASSPPPASTGQPTTFIVGESQADASAGKSTTEVPGSGTMEEIAEFLSAPLVFRRSPMRFAPL